MNEHYGLENRKKKKLPKELGKKINEEGAEAELDGTPQKKKNEEIKKEEKNKLEKVNEMNESEKEKRKTKCIFRRP